MAEATSGGTQRSLGLKKEQRNHWFTMVVNISEFRLQGTTSRVTPVMHKSVGGCVGFTYLFLHPKQEVIFPVIKHRSS